MPTYEYLCRACGTRLEVVQSFSDDALTVCDDCGGDLRKVFSAAGLIFKGSGWHIKDYAAGSSSTGGAKPSSGGSGGDSTSSGSTGGSSGGSTSTSSGSSASSSGSSGSTSSTGSTGAGKD